MGFDNVFEKIKKASESAGGNYFKKHGTYILQVKDIKLKNGFKGTSFIMEAEILEAGPNTNTKPEEGHHNPGETYSIVENLDKAPAVGNVKALLRNLWGLSEQEMTDEVFDKEVRKSFPEGKPSPLIGKLIHGDTYPHEIASGKNQGVLMVRWRWTSISDADAAEYLAQRENAAAEEQEEQPAAAG